MEGQQSTLPDQWAGHCPFCGKSGFLARGRNDCSKCGFRFEIAAWRDN